MKQNRLPAFSVGILAGGKSTRMGQNKALMTYRNETMIERISREMKASGEVLVSASVRGLYEADGIKVVYDEEKEIGPIEGIRQLVKASGEEYIFICAADMPFVNMEIAKYLAGYISSDHDCYVITDEDHVHPLCAIYSKKILPVIEELIREGKYRLMELLNRVRTRYISLEHTDFDRRVVRNVNTKDEFLRLSLPVVFAVSGYKNSGKTWLIEKLINEFISDGYSVGVLKHDGQDHITMAEGTDTFRHRQAGAVSTLVFSDTQFVLTADLPEETGSAGCTSGVVAGDGSREKADAMTGMNGKDAKTEAFIKELCLLPVPPDVILLEGFKSSGYPKVEIVRRSAVPHSVADPDTLICISTDILSPEEVSCPVYDVDDVQGIFSCVKAYFHLDPEK